MNKGKKVNIGNGKNWALILGIGIQNIQQSNNGTKDK
jgi:hypothetical protein